LILNDTNRYHGPGIGQALSHCASRTTGAHGDRPWLWVLDSDCVVARSDAAIQAVSAATAAGAALLGEAAWNRWHEDVRLGGYSLLMDPARAWRPEIGPFVEGGDPVGDFEQSCRRAHLRLARPVLDGDWLSHCGEVESFAVEDYGALKSLRVFYRSGLEVEFGLADPTWARAPLDPGTESVLAGGARVLYDPSYVFRVAKDAAVAQQPVAADDRA
jgi:hypothetical protein